jgi:hypothetical protein
LPTVASQFALDVTPQYVYPLNVRQHAPVEGCGQALAEHAVPNAVNVAADAAHPAGVSSLHTACSAASSEQHAPVTGGGTGHGFGWHTVPSPSYRPFRSVHPELVEITHSDRKF